MSALPIEPAPLDEPQPRLTVVVCTHGRRPLALRRCVESLHRVDAEAVEVLVVDNARRPVVREVLGTDLIERGRGIRVVHEPRRGLDHARNRGLVDARGDLVAYVDDDCEVDPGWPAALIAAFADPTVDCVTGRVLTANPQLDTAQWFDRRYSFDRGAAPERFHRSDQRPWFPVYPWHLGTGCNMAFRRSVLDHIGGFDPALDMGSLVGGGGDLDAFARVLDADAVAAYAPDAIVRHYHREVPKALAEQFAGYGATVSALCVKAVLTRPGQRRAALSFLDWYLTDTVRRLARRGDPARWVPRYLILAEMIGQLWGPVGYLVGAVRTWLRGR